MKKLICVIFAALFLLIPVKFGLGIAYADDEQLSVIATECFLYKEPSFDEKIVDESGNAVMLKFGDSVQAISGGQESDRFMFVSFGQYLGYIFKFYVTSNTAEQEVYPVFNASVVTENAQVFDLQKEETGITLPKNTELYLYEGYKKTDDGLTAVCFVQTNGHLYYGYLKTADLQPYGINAGLITGLVAAASCVTIILLLLFMKKTKNKKTK